MNDEDFRAALTLLAIGLLAWACFLQPFWKAYREGQKRTRTAEIFWLKPSEQEATRLWVEKHNEDRLHILRAGTVALSDYTNCAYGTEGYAVVSLAREGLLDCRRGDHQTWVYTITPLGRAHLEREAA